MPSTWDIGRLATKAPPQGTWDRKRTCFWRLTETPVLSGETTLLKPPDCCKIKSPPPLPAASVVDIGISWDLSPKSSPTLAIKRDKDPVTVLRRLYAAYNTEKRVVGREQLSQLPT